MNMSCIPEVVAPRGWDGVAVDKWALIACPADPCYGFHSALRVIHLNSDEQYRFTENLAGPRLLSSFVYREPRKLDWLGCLSPSRG